MLYYCTVIKKKMIFRQDSEKPILVYYCTENKKKIDY